MKSLPERGAIFCEMKLSYRSGDKPKFMRCEDIGVYVLSQ
jgi:hypothetical protein